MKAKCISYGAITEGIKRGFPGWVASLTLGKIYEILGEEIFAGQKYYKIVDDWQDQWYYYPAEIFEVINEN